MMACKLQLESFVPSLFTFAEKSRFVNTASSLPPPNADRDDPLLEAVRENLPLRPCALCGQMVAFEYDFLRHHLMREHGKAMTVKSYLEKHHSEEPPSPGKVPPKSGEETAATPSRSLPASAVKLPPVATPMKSPKTSRASTPQREDEPAPFIEKASQRQADKSPTKKAVVTPRLTRKSSAGVSVSKDKEKCDRGGINCPWCTRYATCLRIPGFLVPLISFVCLLLLAGP